LAMSNLAKKMTKAGFLQEANEICGRAVKIEKYHKNIGDTISLIKNMPEEENKKEEEIVKKAKTISEFYRDFGHALIAIGPENYGGRYQGPDCVLDVKIENQTFVAEGYYNLPQQRGPLLAGFFTIQPWAKTQPDVTKYHVKYEGKIDGLAVKCIVSKSEAGESDRPKTLLGEILNKQDALMIFSESFMEIKVFEKGPHDDHKFYKITKLI